MRHALLCSPTRRQRTAVFESAAPIDSVIEIGSPEAKPVWGLASRDKSGCGRDSWRTRRACVGVATYEIVKTGFLAPVLASKPRTHKQRT